MFEMCEIPSDNQQHRQVYRNVGCRSIDLDDLETASGEKRLFAQK